MKTKLRRFIASLLIVSVTGLGLPVPAHADIVSTDTTIQADRDRIATMLDRAEVIELLVANGVDPAEVKARVEALTDDEAAQLAAGIDTLPAGGNPIAAVAGGVAILAGVAIFIVALVVVGVVGLVKSLARKSSTPSQESREKPVDETRPYPNQEQEVR